MSAVVTADGDEGAQVTQRGFLSMQVCVPATWNDQRAHEFAERRYPCGTTHGWSLRRQGDPALSGCDERVRCESRAGFVHLMFDA